MKHLIQNRYWLYALLFLIAVGCSSDSPTIIEETDEFTLEKTITIGPGGGTLQTADFSLDIPAGAFGGDFKLSLYSSEEDKTFGNKAVSRLFRVDGIPNFSEPLVMKIKYDGTLTGQNYIAIDEGTTDFCSTTPTTSFDLLPAQESSGFLTCEIAPPGAGPNPASFHSSSGSAGPTSGSLKGKAITGNDLPYYSSNSHFKIKVVDTIHESRVRTIAEYLEKTYRLFFVENGYDSTLTNWPVNVVVDEFPWSDEAHFVSSFWGGFYDRLEFNKLTMGSGEDLGVAAGHELIHLIQDMYGADDSEDLWLNEAVAVFHEGQILNKPYYYPGKFQGNEMAPFNGFHNGSGGSQKHGYGMASLMDYMFVDRFYGFEKTLELYKRLQAGDHPIEAIKAVWKKFVSGDLSLPAFWVRDYFQALMEGSIYYQIEPEFWSLANHVHKQITLAPNDDVRRFTADYQDLSAKVVRINLDYISTSVETIKLSAIGGDYARITAFSYNDNTISWCCPGIQNPITFLDVQGLKNDGYDILAVVCNTRAESPYTSTSECELKIELIKQLPYKYCFVRLDISGWMRYADGTGQQENIKRIATASGSFVEDTFEGSWDKTDDFGMRTHGTLKIRLDPFLNYAREIEFKDTEESATHELHYDFVAKDVPEDDISSADLEFFEAGEATCDIFDAASSIVHTVDHYGSRTKTLVYPICNSLSEITIIFYTEM